MPTGGTAAGGVAARGTSGPGGSVRARVVVTGGPGVYALQPVNLFDSNSCNYEPLTLDMTMYSHFRCVYPRSGIATVGVL